MTTDQGELDSRLRELIATWRARYGEHHESSQYGRAYEAHRCADELDAVRASLGSAPQPPQGIEKELRMEWWLNHGAKCRPYGDDGEMQCCGVDFLRTPLDVLRHRVEEFRLRRVADALREAGGSSPQQDTGTA